MLILTEMQQTQILQRLATLEKEVADLKNKRTARKKD
jgi:hypothetical protein